MHLPFAGQSVETTIWQQILMVLSSSLPSEWPSQQDEGQQLGCLASAAFAAIGRSAGRTCNYIDEVGAAFADCAGRLEISLFASLAKSQLRLNGRR